MNPKHELADFRFQHPTRFFVSGPSGSGKTTWVLNVIRMAEWLFCDPRCKQNVIYFYKEYDEKNFNLAKEDGCVQHWVNEKPTVDMFKQATEPFKNSGGSIVLIDDFGTQIDKDFSEIFQVTSGKFNTTVFLMAQNLFENNARGCSLNASYIIHFQNPRDSQQVATLARQRLNSNYNWLYEAYLDATQMEWTYLIFDNHPKTAAQNRIYSDILPKNKNSSIGGQIEIVLYRRNPFYKKKR